MLTLGAELVVRALHVAPYVFPPPSAVLAELAAEPLLFVRAALVTVVRGRRRASSLGAALALAFAAAAIHSRRLDELLTPLVVASQTVPVIALAPLLVLWMGYGAPPKVVVCALIAFFPMAVTAREGLRATDPQLLLLMRSVGASRRDVFWRVRMPFALPVSGRRRAHRHHAEPRRRRRRRVDRAPTAASATSCSRANARLATAQAFAAIVVITVIGLLAYAAAVLLERRLCWWTPAQKGSA